MAQPTHPVIFTKRATSIIAHGDTIYPHESFTESPDYEGEIGVIIGKPGFRIREEDAMDHVWGYTIVNDMTARERQRDHKQFYIGKSPDTFCPMGPIAVPKEHLPDNLEVQTHVNGEKRQSATLKDLIFSIPVLIKTMSEGQTLQLGDVLATGTPYGVGFGFRPMKFLREGDEVKISVTGLGSLVNRMASPKSTNSVTAQVQAQTYVPVSNDRTFGGIGLTEVSNKKLFYRHVGQDNAESFVLIHGLGGTSDYFTPLTKHFESSKSLHLSDLEGHGLSPTSARSTLTISSFAKDTADMCNVAGVSKGAIVVAHSMGCLVAVKLALDHPELVAKLVLMGPPPSPLPEAGAKATHGRAAIVREKGMLGVVDAVVGAGTSQTTQSSRPMAVAATRLSLLSQDPEGYAKACTALASAEGLDFSQLKCPTFILTGTDDKVSPPQLCEKYSGQISGSKMKVLEGIGHWHLFEDPQGVVDAIVGFVG